jgi:DUF971 family protein
MTEQQKPLPELPKNNDEVELSWTTPEKGTGSVPAVPVPFSPLLRVVWKDGTVGEFSIMLLRRACPCAHCRMLPKDEKGLNRGLYPANLHVTEVKFVGRYGINPVFSDGHSFGIFTYDYLRELTSRTSVAGGDRP